MSVFLLDVHYSENNLARTHCNTIDLRVVRHIVVPIQSLLGKTKGSPN
jgi:hypothetical protein